MNLSLKSKVTVFITAVVIAVAGVSTALSVHAYKKSVEREMTARALAFGEALARSAEEGLASEDLNLIKNVEEIVHTRDVVLVQVFSTLWLGVASVPTGDLNVPAAPDAVSYFARKDVREQDSFTKKNGAWIEVYHPVFFDPHDARVPKILIGFVRLRISTEQAVRPTVQAIAANAVAGILLALIAAGVLKAMLDRSVLKPLLALHHSIARHTEGEFAEAAPVETGGEIGELSREFNAMSRALREREERLAEEKERLAVTLRSIGDGVIVTDIEGTITLMNRVAEDYTGWEAREAAGRPLTDVFTIVNEKTGKPCEQPVQKVIATGSTCGLANHTALIRRDGSRIAIEDSAAPIRDRESRIIGVVLVFRNVSEKRRIEEELMKAEKLQSVGLLAGGIAHDFNNLLTSIVGNISMAKTYIDPRSKAHARLAEAETASRRATDLTYQLLTFSRGGDPVRKASSLGDILRESAGFVLSGTSVAAEFDVRNDAWSADVDAGQMSQVFNNLIINAVQAMPEGGVIRLSVDNCTLEENEVPTLAAGNYVRVSVRDGGTGIRPELLPRIFEPYFTTKQKGSGLGLATVYSIIKRHDGHVTVESRPGAGTLFRLYLPASRMRAAPRSETEGGIADGHGRVLVMDDEQVVRDVAGAMLRELGYEVDFAENGDEAVERYRQARAAKRPYDVVIMDLTIPGGMGGKETIGKLRELDPDVAAVVSSGYSNDPVMARYETYGFQGVIVKPYTFASFSRAISAVMAGRKRGNTRDAG